MSNIVPYPRKNGMTYIQTWRFKIIVKELSPRSRVLQPLSQRLLILTATTTLGCRIRIRRVLVSYQAANSMGKYPQALQRAALLGDVQ